MIVDTMRLRSSKTMKRSTYRVTARLLSSFVFATTIAACAAIRPTWPQIRSVEVADARLNRCASERAEACASDRDCRGARCVAVIGSNAPSHGRDGGHTVRIGTEVLWIFGDTFTPAGMLSSTAGWSRLSDAQTLVEATDAAGLPVQFFPYTLEEAEFDAAHADVPTCCENQAGCPVDNRYCHCTGENCAKRIALWPGDGVALNADEAMLYYEKFVIGAAPYDFLRVGVGLARLRRGEATASRALDPNGMPRFIFGAREPGFARGVVVAEDPARFYLYANVNRRECAVDVVVGRVELTRMAERASYEFWDGSDWVSEMSLAEPILTQVPGGLGSVIWNDHLGAYLSAWNDVCTGGRTLLMRTAKRPEGPWSPAFGVDLAPLGATRDAYYGLLHPEFGSGRSLLLTYFQPLGVVSGQIRVVRLTLE
jgi:hypothetical protein